MLRVLCGLTTSDSSPVDAWRPCYESAETALVTASVVLKAYRAATAAAAAAATTTTTPV